MSGLIVEVKKYALAHSYVFQTLIQILITLIISFVAIKIGKFIIGKFFEKRKLFKYGANNKRLDTMKSLCISIFRYAVYIIAAVAIIASLKLNSILAAAGIGGIVLGLGAQSLIKDIISGFYIVLEDLFAVGDLVSVDSMTGVVEDLELRVTKLRNANGDLHIVPNGEIKKMTNHTRGSKMAVVDIPIPYNADMEKVICAANSVCGIAAKEFPGILEAPSVLGITELGRDGFNLRLTARTQPDDQGPLERRLRLLMVEELGRQKIDMYRLAPYGQEKLHGGDTQNV